VIPAALNNDPRPSHHRQISLATAF
jgi:hypothetical protein